VNGIFHVKELNFVRSPTPLRRCCQQHQTEWTTPRSPLKTNFGHRYRLRKTSLHTARPWRSRERLRGPIIIPGGGGGQDERFCTSSSNPPMDQWV